MVIFDTTSADIKTKTADVILIILKMTTILKEMRIAQLYGIMSLKREVFSFFDLVDCQVNAILRA